MVKYYLTFFGVLKNNVYVFDTKRKNRAGMETKLVHSPKCLQGPGLGDAIAGPRNPLWAIHVYGKDLLPPEFV